MADRPTEPSPTPESGDRGGGFLFSGLRYQRTSQSGAVKQIAARLDAGHRTLVATPNVNHVMRARRTPAYLQALQRFDLLYADGMPIVLASRLMGSPLPERVTGADLLPALCAEAERRGEAVLLAGGDTPAVLEAACEALRSTHPTLAVFGHYPEYGFERDPAMSDALLEAIRSSGASVVFLGVGSPKQEDWLLAHRAELPVAAYLACGMAIGFAAGSVRRAPRWVQQAGAEWIWRLLQEPGRLWRRYLGDLRFLGVILQEWWAGRGGRA
ncbi:glycosyltransferase [Synechococcus sp. RSCCF101]|uniref:WecB/TagA/CpsF family glycosyltransferase n=1 Tax=Synechococcus sp. RSCCF101 TaxID=2511069 RepID=UPI001246EB22|nr:WecB/TagA/CpsF family glycosyltransferase [Synechococcus sp. RSCCF101]QEY31469.1 glycosyltransferase [Synechococcus sp. RSCCF101]